MRIRAVARRHRAELGEVLSVHRGGPGLGTAVAFVLVWLVFSGLTLIRPAESALLIVAAPLAFAVIALVIWTMLAGERLAICERGLIIGSVAPGLAPYVVRYDQIVPGSVVPLVRARRFFRETGTSTASSVRLGWWSREAVHLVGPSPREARRRRAVLAPMLDGAPTTVDGRWPWVAGVHGPAAPVVAQIAQAAGRSGHEALAAAASSAAPRELTGRPEDAAAQIPGQR